jgi:hypothetical protein
VAAPYPGYAPQGPASPVTGPVYRVRLTKVTSLIVVTTRRSAVYTGTLQQLQSIARSVLTHNLLLGWWGLPWGLIRTPMALSQNSDAMRKLRAFAAQPPQVGGPPTQGQPWQAPPAPGQPWQAPPATEQPWQAPPATGQPWQAPPAPGQPWQAQGQPWQGQPPQR